MTPVILLSDGYIANGSEPWRFPQESDLKEIKAKFLTEKEDETLLPYKRNELFVRPWIKPGTRGLEHRIGGLEKQDGTGNVSYDPDNHHRMQLLRQQKRIQQLRSDDAKHKQKAEELLEEIKNR